MLGKLLEGRYQLVQILSAGGFCQTYLAQDTHLPDRPTCVVKHLKPASNTPNSLQTLRWLFTGEAQALQKLGNHDRIPQLLAHFEENQEFYLVQEFVQGNTLSVEMPPGCHWSEAQVFYLLQEILEILQFIHSHGLIHRDIKPNNLLRRQRDRQVVLIDFGSVKQAWTQVVSLQGQKINTFSIGLPATITIGTPGYMPTEQERGKPRPNSDIYALGMVAIQALTGLHPTQLAVDGDSCEVLWQQHCRINPTLADIISKMVSYDFKERYQSATEVLAALAPLTILYQPTQYLEFAQEQDTSAQSSETALQDALDSSQEDTVSFTWDGSEQADNRRDVTDSKPPKKPTSWLDLGIGLAAALALTIGIFFSLRSPDPIIKIEKYPVSIPLKGGR